MSAAATSTPQAAAQPPAQPWPLYDLFLDLPHPGASKSCPGPFLIPSPVRTPVTDEMQSIVPQIARFAFPEFDEDPNNNNTTILNSLQLQNGSRIHGHVRRYLPPHLTARIRYDVGRRGERALVVLTRATGADLLYASILKSIEAISSQQAAVAADKMPHKGNPQQWFLHQLSRYHQHLSQIYASKPPTERGKPLVASIPGLEFGDDDEKVREKFKNVDISRFIIPTSLLQSNTVSNIPPPQAAGGSILPLLRCVGVAHSVRILAALLSEQRVIMVSSSPTRLAFCSHAAVSMLAVGTLLWQHLYIPVLPPHLWQYLAAPYPYLIGILTSTLPRLDRTDGLGEVLIIHLDTNQMETRGMESQTILQRLPDLFRSTMEQAKEQIPTVAASSASEMLAQELFEVLKQDRKILYGESTLDRVGETAAKATKAVKKTFFKLRDKGRQYLQQRGGMQVEREEAAVEPEPDDSPEINSMASDYIYTEGSHNETAEQEVRISFTAFFLCMIGDMRWYLSTPPPDPRNPGVPGVPVLDRKKYLQQKRAMGDGEGTPMWPLLNNFCQTQILEEFAKARVEELRTRAPVTADTPLFVQGAAYCRQHNLDFGILTIRRITRQLAQNSPTRLTGMLQTNARKTAMALTSNKAYEGDYGGTVAQLVEQCRESSSILFDVMSVIWMRLRDSRGMQWKHGYQALQILRNLLYHGPLAVIAEATDGLAKIRAMKYYDNMRSQSVQQVRAAATTVYNLLVDRASLYQIRRVCAERRYLLQNQNGPKRVREPHSRLGVPFRNVHALMHPNASSGTVVRIPPKAPTNERMVRDTVPTQNPASSAPPVVNFFGQTPVDQAIQPSSSSAADDMVGLFDNLAVTASSSTTGAVAPSSSNPFDAFATEQPSSAPPSGNAPSLYALSASSSGENLALAQPSQQGVAPTYAQMPTPPSSGNAPSYGMNQSQNSQDQPRSRTNSQSAPIPSNMQPQPAPNGPYGYASNQPPVAASQYQQQAPPRQAAQFAYPSQNQQQQQQQHQSGYTGQHHRPASSSGNPFDPFA